MKRQQVLVFIGMLALGFAYTNCGQAGSIQLKTIPVNENLASDVPDEIPVMQDPVRETIINCQNALMNNKLMVLNQKINFEDTRVESKKDRICEFAPAGSQEAASGNLSMRNEYMQARYEQHRKLDLPAGAVICDVEMKNDLQRFRYDDVFFFSFNGHLLASNNKEAIEERLMPESKKLAENNFTDIYKYDWLKLRGAGFQNVASDYCAGATEGLAECSWPISEQEGRINFSFAQSLLISMSAGRPSNNQVFSFAITGDDDATKDCYHEKLEFAMSVKYYIPQNLTQ